MEKKGKTQFRPTIPDRVQYSVWGAAAGRCTFCNSLVLENTELGLCVPIGELAHIVGWSDKSPRGKSKLTKEDRSNGDNIILLCRNCHKPTDDGGVVGLYTVEVLRNLKQEHEAAMRALTAARPDKKAVVLRVVGEIRGTAPELTYRTVLEATIRSGLFPKKLDETAYRDNIELDLRGRGNAGTTEYFQQSATEIDKLAGRIGEGILQDPDITQLAVFAFARIPLLVHLGARIDDKVRVNIFQRQRMDSGEAWYWPSEPSLPPQFELRKVREGNDKKVAVIINLSGVIPLEDIPADYETATLYEIKPLAPAKPTPVLIDSPAALFNFERAYREFLAMVEQDHGRLEPIGIFGAIPLSAAITLGRSLMPDVSPMLNVYDRDDDGNFFMALGVKK